ncbi:hypothetical protein I312_100846 [Cryptococcus bacillisporus CA1280]|uniref:uncharacterized protein n=1 Tax=Cryptococcus bacillisporus CA1280 TaxID=1296109 RepID=UPI003368EAFA
MSVQSVRSSLAPLTVSDIIPIMNFTHKALRSLSTSSDSSAISTTSTIPSSSTYSKAWEDMIDRLASHKINTIFDLWSGGNIRLNGLDLTLNIGDAEGLFKAMKTDERFSKFQIIRYVFFDEEKEDWKVGRIFHILALVVLSWATSYDALIIGYLPLLRFLHSRSPIPVFSLFLGLRVTFPSAYSLHSPFSASLVSG